LSAQLGPDFQLKGIAAMAKKWDDHAGAYKKLAGDVARYGMRAIKPLVADFINSYRKVERHEAALPDTLVKARENGVTGDNLASFKKDKGFADTYKSLDKEVDVLWAIQLKIKNFENEALSTANDLKTLADRIHKDITDHEKEQKDAEAKAKKAALKEQLAVEIQRRDLGKTTKEMQDLLSKIEKDRKDLIEAGDLFDKQTDKKMVTYAAKFEKMIEKILDLAPDSKDTDKNDNDPDLPGNLQLKSLSVIVKKAVMSGKAIEKHCAMAIEKAKKDKKQVAPELKSAVTGLEALKKLRISLGKEQKKAMPALRKSKHENEYAKLFKDIENAFQSAVKVHRSAVMTIAKMP
jgi:hypothetical protein